MIQIFINTTIALSYVWVGIFTYNFLNDDINDNVGSTKGFLCIIWPITWFCIIFLYLIIFTLFQKCNLIKTLTKPVIWYFNSAKFLGTKCKKVLIDVI